MKRFLNVVGLLGASTLAVAAQSAAEASAKAAPALTENYQIIERGPDHRVWARAERSVTASGEVVERVRTYTELADGLYYWANNQWEESRAEFEITPEGAAVARHGRHTVTISPILNDEKGAVTLECAGQRLRSTLLGLAVHDRVTGNSLMLAQIKPGVVGRLVSTNEVIFEDCSEDLAFDVRYVYERGGFHQDVILKGSPDAGWLAAQGFSPESSTLEIWTEFFEAPSPRSHARVVSKVEDAGLRGMMAEPEVVEEHLDFGKVSIPLGRAYMRKSNSSEEQSAPVSKRWLKIEGRTFLVETLALSEMKPLVAALPGWKPAAGKTRSLYAGKRPPTPILASPKGKAVLMASLSSVAAKPSVVLDYPLTINGSLTNYTFKGDTTYYVNGPVSLYGTNVLEGGTVIKYAKSANAQLQFYGTMDCRTAPYRPAILTAKDDNTVGETIDGSSGSPSGLYAYAGLYWSAPSVALDLHDLRISSAQYGILLSPGGTPTHVIRDSQFLKNGTGVQIGGGGSAWLRNVLLYQSSLRAVNAPKSTIRGEHLTIHEANALYNGGEVSVTNSLFVSVTNWTPGFAGVNNATNSSATGVFQTVGAGGHYLAESSAYRDAGTTNVSAGVLLSIRERTTAPPLMLTNTATGEISLSPQAQRDTDLPDLGYHYPPVDYITAQWHLTNAVLSVHPGTVIARDYSSGGIWLDNSASIVSAGTPDRRVVFASYAAVQESPVALGSSGPSVGMPFYCYRSGGVAGSGLFRFTDFDCLAAELYSLYAADQWSMTPLSVRDCSFYGGSVYIGGSVALDAALNNNLFERGSLSASGEHAFLAANNLLRNGGVNLETFVDSWVFVDNALEGSQISVDGSLTQSNNAYINTTINCPTNSSDVILTSFAYASGPLGDYYQVSTNLLNRGSRSAAAAGLYHYTTTTNQVKEAGSQVDIGLHYVATDGTGFPLDYDGDGLADWEEDANGDGSITGDSTSWTNYTSLNGLGVGNVLQVFTPLKP